MTNTAIVKQYLEAFGNKDMETARKLVADSFKFNGPMQQHESANAFFEAMEGFVPMVAGIDLVGTAENGEWVGTYYNFRATVPGLENTTTSEWFRVADGKIQESHLVFDASNWRKMMENM